MTKADTIKNDRRAAFLANAGWANAIAKPLAGDASTRCYERLTAAGRKAVLMIAPPGAEEPACPKSANREDRKALGYNAAARLAGPNLNAFIAVSKALKSAGLSAPEIYAADPANGFALIEDLGDDLFARVVTDRNETTLYRAAIDALVALRAAAMEPPDNDGYAMLDYDNLALETEADLLLDWCWPLKHRERVSDDLCKEYKELWKPLLGAISPPHIFVLRDYHAENLLWLPQRADIKRVGVIDFQDALFGAAAYDVVSLLEDARRDVDPGLAEQMIDYYAGRAAERCAFNREQFMRDYAILAAQRNAKILGIFARLAKRDQKPRYLDLLPRVESHFRRDLKRPGLEPLAGFFARHFKEFA